MQFVVGEKQKLEFVGQIQRAQHKNSATLSLIVILCFLVG